MLSLLTGIGQVAIGVLSYPETHWSFGQSYTNTGQRDLSLLNIGFGTATVALGTWNLLANRKGRQPTVSWNAFSRALPGNETAVGITLTRRF